MERIEPGIGNGRATLLTEYPAHLAALARPKPGDPRVAERFELYACGVELANAFGELTDPAEQRRRLEAEMAEKQRIYGERYPIDEDFLAALAHMPPASGAALGFDRLVMLATGATSIEQVLWRRRQVPTKDTKPALHSQTPRTPPRRRCLPTPHDERGVDQRLGRAATIIRLHLIVASRTVACMYPTSAVTLRRLVAISLCRSAGTGQVHSAITIADL